MNNVLKKGLVFKVTSLSFCLGWLITIQCLNQVPMDVGDGLIHYYISNASWKEPILFLDHWGKPLFILLNSGFAQFGLNGVIAFNILVFVITIIFAWKIMNHFSIAIGVQCFFPLILINIYDYSSTVLGGLTEPLFSLFVMITSWLIITKRWMWFAIIVSFFPFLRSEGQLAVILAFIILVIVKQYKYLPFLFLGFILYSIVGSFALNDFWWYFNMNPYKEGNHIYGSGPWFDYVLAYRNYLGNIGLIIFLFALIRLSFLFYSKKWTEIHFPLLIFSYGIFLGIVITHSYFWAKGIHGSMGLSRIATQGMPTFLLLNICYLGRISFNKSWVLPIKIILASGFILIGFKCINSKYFPIKATPLEQQVLMAADYLLPLKNKGNHFFFHHPLFVYKMGGNPFLKNQKCIFYYNYGLKNDLDKIIKSGDYLIRDSYFGPQEMRLPFSEVQEIPEMVVVKKFISNEQKDDKYGEIEGVTIYQYVPSK